MSEAARSTSALRLNACASRESQYIAYEAMVGIAQKERQLHEEIQKRKGRKSQTACIGLS